jgi:hypothetical protein
MNSRIKIPLGGIGEVAEYKEQIVEDYRDNPFIEALPEILTKEEVIHKLTSYPPFNEEERHLDVHYRYHIAQRLFQYFQPLSIHIDLESRISRMIRQGYLARNPFNTEYKKGLHDGYEMIQKLRVNGNTRSNYYSLWIYYYRSFWYGQITIYREDIVLIPSGNYSFKL